MSIPTEPIGSIPRPAELLQGMKAFAEGAISSAAMEALYDEAVRDTIERFEATGSPVLTDGEQSKPSFATYPIHGRDNLAPDGVTIPFVDGHTRRLPRLTSGPFRYRTYADSDDTSTARDTAFAKIQARVEGTRLAAEVLGQ